MRYPDECPVFEVVKLVMGTGGVVISGDGGTKPLEVGDVFECYPYNSPGSQFPLRGAGPYPFVNGVPLMLEEVRPLTRAAREMLALVKS